MDLQRYWNDVRAVMETLPRQKIYYLISIDNPEKGTTAGRVMDVADAKQAAKLIVGRTHVVASPADVERFESAEKLAAEELAEIEYRRKGQLAMPKELQDLVKMAARREEPDAKKKEK